MPWGFVAAAGIGAVGSYMAADKQASGQEQAAQTQADMFNKINGQEQPFIQAGQGATSRLTDLMGTSGNTGASGYGSLAQSFSPADFLANKDPGYDFQLQTGGQALRNADTPGMGALSGAALKDLVGFNQNMAATGYQNAYNRFNTNQNNIYARLSGIAGLGQNAATQVGTSGTQLGIGMGQAQAGAAASQAGGIVGATNSLSGGANTLAGMMYLNGGSSGSPDGSAAGGYASGITQPPSYSTGGG